MTTQQTTIQQEQGLTTLLQTAYQLAAKDIAKKVYATEDWQKAFFLGEAEDIKAIKTQEDLKAFTSNLPTKQELIRTIKQKIIDEYRSLEDTIKDIGQREKTALQEPLVYANQLGLFSTVASNISMQVGNEIKIQFKDNYTNSKPLLAKGLAKSLDDAFKPIGDEGLFAGDEIIIQGMHGMDMATFEENYFHGGDASDLPIDAKGVLTGKLGDDHYQAVFKTKNGTITWSLHPEEFKTTNANRYKALIEQHGGFEGAANALIADTEAETIGPFLEDAKKKIHKIFAAERDATTTKLAREYGLDQTQLNNIAKGKDFAFEPPFLENYDKDNVAVEFKALADFANVFFRFYEKREKNMPFHIDDEKAFTAFMQKKTKKALLDKIGKEMSSLLEKQYYLKNREVSINESGEDVFPLILDKLAYPGGRSEASWNRRLIIYNNRELFKGGDPFSPPSEELNRVLKLETGDGCNYRKCTFCVEYAGAKFFVADVGEFDRHTDQVKEALGKDLQYIQRVFLSGGNIFALPANQLKKYLHIVDKKFNRQYVAGDRTRIRRVEAFTRTEGIETKSVRELQDLYENNLKLLYWGCETGSDEVLQYVHKGITKDRMIKAAEKIDRTNINLSIMIMPGLGGIRHAEAHAKETIELLNILSPRYTTFHTVTPRPGSLYAKIMDKEVQEGTNRPLTNIEVVQQIREIVNGMEDGYTSLVATYYPPSSKISINPVSFRGYFNRRDGKRDIIRTLDRHLHEKAGILPNDR